MATPKKGRKKGAKATGGSKKQRANTRSAKRAAPASDNEDDPFSAPPSPSPSPPPPHQQKRQRKNSPTPSPVKHARATKRRVASGKEDDDVLLNKLKQKIANNNADNDGYVFFSEPYYPPVRQLKNGVPLVLFHCKTCAHIVKKEVNVAPSWQLHKHGERCAAEAKKAAAQDAQQPRMSAYEGWEDVTGLDASEVLQAVATWCACDIRAYNIIKDVGLLPLLDPVVRANLPGPQAISDAIIQLYGLTKSVVVKNLLKRAVGMIFISCDAWLAGNGIDLLGVLAFFRERDGHGGYKTSVMPLDFIPLVKGHTAAYLRKVLVRCFEEFGIENQIGGIASDNASVMEACVKEIDVAGGYLDGTETWIRCFSHIQNISVTTFNSYFTSCPTAVTSKRHRPAPKEWVFDDEEEREFVHSVPTAPDREGVAAGDVLPADLGLVEKDLARDDRGDSPELDKFKAKKETVNDRYTRQDVRDTMERCRLYARKCRYNPRLSEALRFISARTGNEHNPHSIPRRMPVCWNSFLAQFRAVYHHRDEIKELQADKSFGILKENYFDQKDFDILEDIIAVLEPFEEVTLKFSERGARRIEEVVLLLDLMITSMEHKFLDTTNPSVTVPPCVYNAVLLAKTKLEKYYSASDACIFYSAAMVLHPSYGPAYLSARKWPDTWIKTAISRAQQWYNIHYRPAAEAKHEEAQAVIAAAQARQKKHDRPLTVFEQLAATAASTSSPSRQVNFDTLIHDFVYRTHDKPTSAQPVDALSWFARRRRAGGIMMA